MATNTLKTRIINAYKTESEWSSSNPVLLLGEKAYTKDGINNGHYKIGNGTSTWMSLPYIGSPNAQKTIIESHTYSNIYASANNFNEGTFYFGYIRPNTYYDEWHIKYRISSSVPGQNNYTGFFEVELWGSQSLRTIYKCTNAHYSTSYRTLYYHTLYSCTSTGYTNGYGHLVGIGLRSSANPTSSSYARTFKIELIEQDNCIFSFYDTICKFSDVPGTGSTNYSGYNEFDGSNNGLQESGDNNTISQLHKDISSVTAGTNGVYGYTIIMRDSTKNTFQSIVTASGTGTTKSKNTSGFYPQEIYFFNPGNNNKISSGSLTGARIYQAFSNTDLRYTLNCGQTLTANKPIYLKGIIANGLFYISDEMYSQQLPESEDEYVYIYIGDAYDTYRGNISATHPIYQYKNGRLCLYLDVNKTDIGLGNVENKSSATIRSEITSSNITNALGYTPVNKNGDTITGNIKFVGPQHLCWDNGTYQQRINLTNDSTDDTEVFSFQQSLDSGSNFTNLMVIKDNGKIVANTFIGNLDGNANTATASLKATNDSSNQKITTTYIKSLSADENVITYTKGDNSTETVTLSIIDSLMDRLKALEGSVPKSITFQTMPKTNYQYGDAFDPSDAVAIITFMDDTTITVSGSDLTWYWDTNYEGSLECMKGNATSDVSVNEGYVSVYYTYSNGSSVHEDGIRITISTGFDYTISTSKILYNADITLSNGEFVTSDGTRAIYNGYIKVKPNTRYTITRNNTKDIFNNDCTIAPRCYDENKVYLYMENGCVQNNEPRGGLVLDFTTTANCRYFTFIDECNTNSNGVYTLVEV